MITLSLGDSLPTICLVRVYFRAPAAPRAARTATMSSLTSRSVPVATGFSLRRVMIAASVATFRLFFLLPNSAQMLVEGRTPEILGCDGLELLRFG